MTLYFILLLHIHDKYHELKELTGRAGGQAGGWAAVSCFSVAASVPTDPKRGRAIKAATCDDLTLGHKRLNLWSSFDHLTIAPTRHSAPVVNHLNPWVKPSLVNPGSVELTARVVHNHAWLAVPVDDEGGCRPGAT